MNFLTLKRVFSFLRNKVLLGEQCYCLESKKAEVLLETDILYSSYISTFTSIQRHVQCMHKHSDTHTHTSIQADTCWNYLIFSRIIKQSGRNFFDYSNVLVVNLQVESLRSLLHFTLITLAVLQQCLVQQQTLSYCCHSK